MDANESGLEETGILSSALSKKDSRHHVVLLTSLLMLRFTSDRVYRVSSRWFASAVFLCSAMHVTRMPDNVPTKAVLRVACDVRDGVPPFPNWRRPWGRPPITWLHQICSDCGLSTGDALNCAQDRAVWRTYAMASSASHQRQRLTDVNMLTSVH